MKIFVTSDMHFNHKTMVKEKWRDFDSVQQMNDYIITQWNKVVSEFDMVYILGDVCISGYSNYKKEIECKLNGWKLYIKGNHDSNSLTNIQKMMIKFNGVDIVLVHNPKEIYIDVDSEVICLHGHQHISGNHDIELDEKKFYNVNLEYHKYKPKLLNEIIGEIRNKRK